MSSTNASLTYSFLAQKMTKSATPTWENSRMDKSLRPPEVILGLPYSSKVDVWMLGCAVSVMLFFLKFL